MAKMKNKKAEEQVDWNSPPPSPKAASKEPVTEPIPASPASLLLSEETTEPTLTESTPEDLARSSDSPNVAKIDEKPVEGSTLEPSPPEPATEGILAEGPLAPPSPPQSEVPSPLEEEETEPAPEAVKEDEIPDNRGQAEGVNSDPVAEPASEPASEEAPVATDSLSVETDQPATQETETLEPTSTEVAEGSVEESLPPAEERPSEENTREVVETTADPVPVTAESTVKSLPKQKEIVEDVKGPEPIPEDTVKEVKELDPLPVEVSVKAALEAPEVPFEVPQAAAEAPETTIAPPEPPVERPVEIPIFAPVEAKSPPRPKAASPILPEEHSFSPRSIVTERPPVSNTFLRSPPKPSAINHIIEDSRPPSAPSPPVTRARPRYNTSAFETDSEDDSALIRPRLRDEALSRESSRGPNYPPTQPRSLFASRVPVEHYSSPPPPPPPPPGYHHSGYYPPAPPYYHGPSHMRQPGGYPQHSPYGPSSHVSHTSHSSSPYPETWQHPPHYGPYGTHSPRRHDSLSSRDFGRDFGGLPTLENGPLDDETNVFSRLSQAIPDLHVLLAKYKETHGQLGVREELLRRADAEQQEKLRAKDQEIQSLRERVTRLESKHSIEASKLRLEIGNMEDQVKELKEQLAETVKFKSEAEKLRATLDRATKYWESRHKELEEAHSTLKKLSTEEAAKSRKEFDEWRSTATTKHDAEKIALAIQFDKKLKEADVSTDNLRQDAAAAFAKEKDALKRQQREREANFDNVRKELESKLGSAQLDREQALKREREGMEAWAKERGNLVQSHREDIQSLRMSIKNEADKSWIDLHAEANRKAEERNALAEQLMKEKDGLQKQYNALKAESGKERDIIKSVVGNLESEKARLEKLMECYGDIAEIKSKGDTYYLVSFEQLQKQIMELAATHFVHLPVSPPPDDLSQVPYSLPSFLGETYASRQLRTAYVAHIVAKLITYRVFGPFLFSLGRRYDKADSLFSSMSAHIRDKSTRKEAIWRQQTLLAAFTSSGAKQRINTAAGTVVEEIVNAIKNFAAPKEEEAIKIAVKRIVKLAAETWRFARLEREMITAFMPALEDEEHQFTGPKYWAPYQSDTTPAGTTSPSNKQPKLLLRLFPIIYREPRHENFREADDDKPDDGCVYHHGTALYDDADSVVQRAEELKAAGLPPITTASPTAADFPPPLLPAPRDPVPPTPDAEKSSTRAKSPPPNTSNTSNKKSKRSSHRFSVPPPLPTTTEDSEAIDKSSRRSSTIPPLPASARYQSKRSSAQYFRPPPIPNGYNTPKDLPLRALDDSMFTSHRPPPPPPPESIAPSMHGLLAHELLKEPRDIIPAFTESAIIPPFAPPESTKDGGSDLPTPPHSRANTPNRPISPLFSALDDLDTITSHRLRNHSSTRSHSRRRSRPSEEAEPPTKDKESKDREHKISDPLRRTSLYTLHTRSSSDNTSLRSDKSDRSSRWLCESRSAAIKGLYPKSPLAGVCPSPSLSRTSSLRSQKKSTKPENSIVSTETGTWDTHSQMTSVEGIPEPPTITKGEF